MRKLLLMVAAVMLLVPMLRAQDPLEEYFYASGKIRVVIAIIGLVLLGILAYVIALDLRVRKLEKKK